jgi:hypothetical protein
LTFKKHFIIFFIENFIKHKEKNMFYKAITIFIIILIISCSTNDILPIISSSTTDPSSIITNGNTSNPSNVPDVKIPIVNSIILSSGNVTAKPLITFEIEATDNTGITGWIVTLSSTKPISDSSEWLTVEPTSFNLTAYGENTIYIWCKDASGNVSASKTFTVNYVQPGTEDTNWNKSFDGIVFDSSLDIKVDSSGNVYAGATINGTSNKDMWIKKFDSEGTEDLTWNKKIDGGSDDTFSKLAIDSEGNVFVTGNGINLISSENKNDWWTMKYDSSGSELWNKKIDGVSTYSHSNDQGRGIITDYKGIAYIVANGTRYTQFDMTDNGSWQFESLHYFNGKLFFSNVVFDCHDINNYSVNGIGVDNHGCVSRGTDTGILYVIGHGTNLVSESSGKDWFFKRFGLENEDVYWDKVIDGNSGDDSGQAVTVDSLENVYAAGYGTNLVSGSSKKDWMIKKFDFHKIEDLNWNKKIDGNSGDDEINTILVGPDGNIYVAGYGTNLVSGSSKKDWWIKSFSQGGTELSDKKIDKNGSDDMIYAFTIDGNGNWYIASYEDSKWTIEKFIY